MTEKSGSSRAMVDESVSDHIADARHLAREVLTGETHLGDADDWRQSLVSARDGIALVWLLWVAMQGFGVAVPAGPILVTVGLGFSLYWGIATAVATRVRLRYLERELERERHEIRDHPEHEREEVRALYAAKGFREPLLTQITDTLCADDDRLLKVMMEEELGLFIHHINHPLLVGVWNAVGAAMGTLLLAAPVCVQQPHTTRVWLPAGAAVLMTIIATVNAKLTRRGAVQVSATWLAMTAVCGGATYLVGELLAGRS